MKALVLLFAALLAGCCGETYYGNGGRDYVRASDPHLVFVAQFHQDETNATCVARQLCFYDHAQRERVCRPELFVHCTVPK